MAAFETLNPRQREAATYGQRAKGAFHSGPLVILAGPAPARPTPWPTEGGKAK
jgi:hypothetical protein